MIALLLYLEVLICLLALSVGIDAGKKKLLKKLAKELGYKLEDAIKSNLKVKFIYSEKATKCCEIFLLLLSYGVPVKSKGKISQNFVAFSEYMNFTNSNFEAG